MKTFFFDTGVKPHNFTPPVPIMPGHVLRGTIQIPFDCEDVPDNAIFRFACDDPQPMESHIIREIHNSAMVSKYAVFLVPDLGEPKNPAAVTLGSMRSDKKAAAAKENGKRGGRPRLTLSEMAMKMRSESRYTTTEARPETGLVFDAATARKFRRLGAIVEVNDRDINDARKIISWRVTQP